MPGWQLPLDRWGDGSTARVDFCGPRLHRAGGGQRDQRIRHTHDLDAGERTGGRPTGAHADRDTDCHGDSDCQRDDDAYRYGDGHRYAGLDTDHHGDGDAGFDTDCHGDGDAHRHRGGDAHRNPGGNAHANSRRDAAVRPRVA
jgi:hypothetical protein